MSISILAYHDNLVYLDNGTVWAYYRLNSEHVSYVDDLKKEKSKVKLKNLLKELSVYQDIDLKLLPRDMTLLDRFEQLSRSYLDSTRDVAEYYANKTIDYLSQSVGQIYVYDWLIGLPISVTKQEYNLISTLKNQTALVHEKIMMSFGYEVILHDNWYQDFIDEEEKLYFRLSAFNPVRFTKEEMQYMTRINYIRGMSHSLHQEYSNTHIDNITDAIVDDISHVGILKLKSYEGVSYVSILPLSETKLDIVNNHIVESLQSLHFPIECHFHLSHEIKNSLVGITPKAKQAEARVNSISTEMKNKKGKIFEKFKYAKKSVDDLQIVLQSDNPIFKWQCFVVLYDKDVRVLKKNIDRFLRFSDKKGFKFSRALFDQYYLFERLFFGTRIDDMKNWLQYSTNETFSEMLLFTNQRLGNKSGFYIGRVDSRVSMSKSRESAIANSKNIVLFSPTVANKGVSGALTDSPHIAITGETGKGKSYLMKLLFLYSTFIAKTLYYDPKREVKTWFNKVIEDKEMCRKYPFLIKHLESFNYVTLDSSNQETTGILDPIVFINDDTVKDIVEDIFKRIQDFSDRPTAEAELLEIINDVIVERQKGKLVGMKTIIDRLKEHELEEVNQTGRILENRVKNSVLELIFSDGTVKGLDLQANTTILEVFGLDLPNINTSVVDYSITEKKSLCVMFVLGKYFEKFGSQNPNEDTIEFMDEVWQYTSTSIGKKILNAMKRTGRSYNNMLCYGTQSVLDIDNEEDKGNFGTLFAFDEPTERREIIEHLNLEYNDKSIDLLANTIKGQCLFLDIYRHLGKLTVHCPFVELDTLFKTVEKTNISQTESNFV